MQGGGLFIGDGSTVTLTNTNVYSNQATEVALAFSTVLELSTIAPLVLDVRSHGSQGGGVYVTSNAVASFEICNIHDNNATSVRLHLKEPFPELSSINGTLRMGSIRGKAYPLPQTHMATVSTPAGRWMKVQGKFKDASTPQ